MHPKAKKPELIFGIWSPQIWMYLFQKTTLIIMCIISSLYHLNLRRVDLWGARRCHIIWSAIGMIPSSSGKILQNNWEKEKLKNKGSDFVVSIVPADVLALSGTETSAGEVMTSYYSPYLQSTQYTNQVLESIMALLSSKQLEMIKPLLYLDRVYIL